MLVVYAGDQYTHRFVGAATSAIIVGGTYSHAFRYATENAIHLLELNSHQQTLHLILLTVI